MKYAVSVVVMVDAESRQDAENKAQTWLVKSIHGPCAKSAVRLASNMNIMDFDIFDCEECQEQGED
jgi:hypothetical protein